MCICTFIEGFSRWSNDINGTIWLTPSIFISGIGVSMEASDASVTHKSSLKILIQIFFQFKLFFRWNGSVLLTNWYISVTFIITAVYINSQFSTVRAECRNSSVARTIVILIKFKCCLFQSIVLFKVHVILQTGWRIKFKRYVGYGRIWLYCKINQH